MTARANSGPPKSTNAKGPRRPPGSSRMSRTVLGQKALSAACAGWVDVAKPGRNLEKGRDAAQARLDRLLRRPRDEPARDERVRLGRGPLDTAAATT